MIYFIEGKILEKSPANVVIENNGIAYVLNIPFTTYQNIGEIGENVRLYTYLKINEEEVNLYGFFKEEERKMFEYLISVPGIGPKVALRILSGIEIEQLYLGIINEDIEFLSRIPGVGKKTGERLIVELKNRIKKLEIKAETYETKEREKIIDAIEALIVLGLKRKEATEVINKIVKEKPSLSLDEIIREALKKWKID